MATKEIKLKIHDEDELYSPLDPDRNILSDDVVAYLARVFVNKHRRLKENYVITVISDTPVDEERIKSTIRNEFLMQKDDLRYGLRRLFTKMVCLAALGIAILSLWLVLSVTTGTVWVEILSIMGWVFVWEATSIAVMQRTELRLALLNLERLNKADIVVKTSDDQ